MKDYAAKAGEGMAAPEAASTAPAGQQAKNELVEWVKSALIAVALFFLIRTFLVQAYTIPSGSMEQTLLIGDYLMANNAIFGARIPFTELHVPAIREPRHGDIVVFRPTYNDPVIDVVKRVMGAPGDTMQMIERTVYRNGKKVEEPYADPDYLPDEPMHRYGAAGYDWHFSALAPGVNADDYQPSRDSWGPLVVPAGQYMLLGDNRDESLDSRYMGFIPRDVIRGKAMFIYYSIDHEVDRPFPHVVTAARWGRIGSMIK